MDHKNEWRHTKTIKRKSYIGQNFETYNQLDSSCRQNARKQTSEPTDEVKTARIKERVKTFSDDHWSEVETGQQVLNSWLLGDDYYYY
jgi:hypothetical protein